MFDKITIIGAGLIGSSIARAVRKHNLAKELVISDSSVEVCDRAIELELADDVVQKAKDAVRGADLVFLCMPVGAMGQVAREIAGFLKEGAIVTDVGSVKEQVVNLLKSELPDYVEIVPGHPIAGTEHSGPDAGFAELFEGRWCILTPSLDTAIRATEKLTFFWEACGSRIEIMDARHHDLVLGITSHLPHLIAYTIVQTANELEDDIKSEVIKFSASGFRDFTRIAASDPVMWRDVFLNNRDSVLEVLQRFSEDLTAMQKAIRKGDGDYLYRVFDSTRKVRREVIEQGQADYAAAPQLIVKGGQAPGTPPVTASQQERED